MLAVAISTGRSSAAPPIRGVVFILTDDQRADFLGVAGRDGLETPAIDALAARATRFDRAYCQGSRSPAVCLPSRSRMLTGGSDWTTPDWQKAQQRDDLPLWPELLRDAGWRTHHVGKWHAGRRWFDRAFESGESVLFGGMGSHWTLQVEDRPLDGEPATRSLREYSTREFGAAAVDFLDEHLTTEPDRPFVLHLCFTAPHDPRTVPGDDDVSARAARVELPGNILPVHPFDNGEMTIRDETLLGWPRTESDLRREIAIYEMMIEEIDAQVAAIVETLDANDALDDVLIVFASDHGLALGSHGLLGKQSLYEHSMRAPMVFAGPGFEDGAVRDDFAYLHDLAPTILAACGIEIPTSMAGRDLHGPTDRDHVLLRYRDLHRSWRDDRWKVIWHPRIDRWQVFDLMNDPNETTDLARDPANAALVARLRRALLAAREAAGDDVDLLADRPEDERFDHEAANERRESGRHHWTLR
jgi:arylsulfatase A-like enzyme